jgi:hypothetical protein
MTQSGYSVISDQRDTGDGLVVRGLLCRRDALWRHNAHEDQCARCKPAREQDGGHSRDQGNEIAAHDYHRRYAFGACKCRLFYFYSSSSKAPRGNSTTFRRDATFAFGPMSASIKERNSGFSRVCISLQQAFEGKADMPASHRGGRL